MSFDRSELAIIKMYVADLEASPDKLVEFKAEAKETKSAVMLEAVRQYEFNHGLNRIYEEDTLIPTDPMADALQNAIAGGWKAAAQGTYPATPDEDEDDDDADFEEDEDDDDIIARNPTFPFPKPQQSPFEMQPLTGPNAPRIQHTKVSAPKHETSQQLTMTGEATKVRILVDVTPPPAYLKSGKLKTVQPDPYKVGDSIYAKLLEDGTVSLIPFPLAGSDFEIVTNAQEGVHYEFV